MLDLLVWTTGDEDLESEGGLLSSWAAEKFTQCFLQLVSTVDVALVQRVQDTVDCDWAPLTIFSIGEGLSLNVPSANLLVRVEALRIPR